MIRIDEIDLGLREDVSKLEARIITLLGIKRSNLKGFEIVKRAIDSRNKNNIMFVYSVVVELLDEEELIENSFWKRHRVRVVEPFNLDIPKLDKKPKLRPVVVGAGPCGLFAALTLAKMGACPIMIERGSSVEKRVEDVNKFFMTGELNVNSNVQFGEGGAGTFSDGKLYTLINDELIKCVFEEMVEAGAPEEIMYDAKPHVGTDKLRGMVKNIREKIISLGGEVHFDTIVTDIIIENDAITGVITESTIDKTKSKTIKTDKVIMALGHSSRDSYEMMFNHGINMESKPFAVGVRIEHRREDIDMAQYGKFAGDKKLGAARYKLVEHLKNGRTCYTFCQCPGGVVVGSASEEGGVVTNGMSYFAQDEDNTNSALLVNVTPDDFGSSHPLAGIEFQRDLERKAFVAGGSNYFAPAQTVKDFMNKTVTKRFSGIFPSYRPSTTFVDLNTILPKFVADGIKQGIVAFDRKVKGFAIGNAILTGVETRSSSPVRILRNSDNESNIKGLYPAGEGAGYAGGIVSSAVDGIKVAIGIYGK